MAVQIRVNLAARWETILSKDRGVESIGPQSDQKG